MTDVTCFCQHKCGRRKDDHFAESALRGINHAVTAVLHMTKAQDDPVIKQSLVNAAKMLKEIQERTPIQSPMLDVDWFLGVPDPWKISK